MKINKNLLEVLSILNDSIENNKDCDNPINKFSDNLAECQELCLLEQIKNHIKCYY